MEQFLTVPIESIVQSKTNPRKHFDEKQLADLQESIKTKGIINPLLVRPIQACVPIEYEIVAGERRWRAAQEVGLETVPAIVRDLTDEQALEIQVVENLQRADVHPLDEAEGYRQLMKLNKCDEQSIAAKLGKSITYVLQRVKLLDLIESAKKAFMSDEMTVTHALHIARLSPEAQEKVMENCFETWNDTMPTVKNLIEYIQTDVMLDLSAAPFVKDEAKYCDESELCQNCQKRTGYNQMLFSDIAKKDMCMDQECFNQKKEAHLQWKIDQSKESGVNLVKISPRYYAKNGVLTDGSYEIISKKDAKNNPDALQAIYVDGSEQGKIVHILTEKNVKIDGHIGLSDEEKARQAEKKEETKKREREIEIRKRTIAEIVKKVNEHLSVEDLRMICAEFLECGNLPASNIDYSSCGVQDEDGLVFGDYEDRIQCFPKSAFSLNKFLMQLALIDCLKITEYNDPDDTKLRQAADRYGVDHAAIGSQVEEEFSEKKKQPKKSKNSGSAQ